MGSEPKTVITDLGILTLDPETKELTLTALPPGVTVEGAKEATGWDLKVAEDVAQTDPPSERGLSGMRYLHARTEAARSGMKGD